MNLELRTLHEVVQHQDALGLPFHPEKHELVYAADRAWPYKDICFTVLKAEVPLVHSKVENEI